MRVITYFKTENAEKMIVRLLPIIRLLDRYNIAYDVIFTNQVGKIVYEDEYQVAAIPE